MFLPILAVSTLPTLLTTQAYSVISLSWDIFHNTIKKCSCISLLIQLIFNPG